MGAPEVRDFLTHLATERNVSASTQAQALNALVFLYEQVLGREAGELAGFERAKKVSVVSTTMIYTHVMNRPGLGVRSPLD